MGQLILGSPLLNQNNLFVVFGSMHGVETQLLCSMYRIKCIILFQAETSGGWGAEKQSNTLITEGRKGKKEGGAGKIGIGGLVLCCARTLAVVTEWKGTRKTEITGGRCHAGNCQKISGVYNQAFFPFHT